MPRYEGNREGEYDNMPPIPPRRIFPGTERHYEQDHGDTQLALPGQWEGSGTENGYPVGGDSHFSGNRAELTNGLMHPWSEVASHLLVGVALGFTTPVGETGTEIAGSIPFVRNVVPVLYGTRPEARLTVFIPFPFVNAHTAEALLKALDNLTGVEWKLPGWGTTLLSYILGGEKTGAWIGKVFKRIS